MGMQRCAAEDNLDMVSASVHVLALVGGGECPVAERHSFLYEGRIPVRGLGAYPPPPFPVCSAVAGGGPCACGYLCCAHRVLRVNTCGCMECMECME